jgi:hypothetical protein
MGDRRNVERFDLALPSTLGILVEPREVVVSKPIDCLTRDISSAGAYFLTREPLPTGTFVEIEMILTPESGRRGSALSQVKAKGSVVRTEPAGMAVCFSGRCRLLPYP